MRPDQLVTAYGEDASHQWLSTASYDADDVLDVDASTFTTDPIKVFPSAPSERELVRFQGREGAPTLRLTVQSTLDIQADREGIADHVTFAGRFYAVVEVRDDRHPLTGVSKKTVLLAPEPGDEAV